MLNNFKVFIAKVKRFTTKHLLLSAGATTVVTVVFISELVLLAEKIDPNHNIKNHWDAIWWGFVTVATVGYGDKFPITEEGRSLAIVLFVFGMVMIGILTATISAELFKRLLNEGRGVMDTQHLSNHLIICGWKDHMENLLEHVLEFNPGLKSGEIVVMANLDVEHIRQIREIPDLEDTQFIVGEYFNEVNLKKAHPEKARKILILSDQTPLSNGQRPTVMEADARTIMTAMTLAKISPATPVTAEIIDPKMTPYLKLAHVHEIIFPREYSRLLISNASSGAGVANIMFDLLDPHTPTVIRTRPIPEEFFSKTYGELKQKYFSEKNSSLLMGILENTGNSHRIKDAALRQAQKTPNPEILVGNLQRVKNLKFNNPVFNPADDFILNDHCSVIVLEKRTT